MSCLHNIDYSIRQCDETKLITCVCGEDIKCPGCRDCRFFDDINGNLLDHIESDNESCYIDLED